MKEIQLISSQFPSGVAWLLNFLLEIDVLIYREDKIENTWNLNNEGIYSLKNEQLSLKQWIPTLSNKSSFLFRDNIAVRWSHSFPNSQNFDKSTIVLTRDGRDAIYSYYKRSNFEETFNTALHRVDTLLSMPYPETWAIFNLLWTKIIPAEKLFVISFEKIKSNPLPVLKELLNFLKITRTDEELTRAIEQSSFENAKKAEEEYQKNNPQSKNTTINRGGKIKEWEKTMSEKELFLFTGLPNEILKEFNYDEVTEKNATKNNIEKYFLVQNKNEELRKYIDDSLWSAKYADWQEAKETLLRALTKTNNDLPYVLKIGTMLVCIEWLEILYKHKLQKLDEQATEIFNVLLKASDRMKNKPFFLISIARNLCSHNKKRESLTVLEIARNISDNNAYELTEIARIYANNRQIFEAIKIFNETKNKNWTKIVLKDYKKILKRFLKNSPLYDILLNLKRLKYKLKMIANRPKLPINRDGKVLIHLGCGDQNDERFINVDALPFPHVHYVKNVEKLDCFKNNFADLIYTCHTLEHIGHQEILNTLKEWRRVLKVGGTLRISVPDLDNLINIYKEKNCKITAIEHALMGGQDYEYNYHKSIFSQEYLTKLLLATGFRKVNLWNPKNAKYYSFNDWASRKIEGKYNISLNLEATK